MLKMVGNSMKKTPLERIKPKLESFIVGVYKISEEMDGITKKYDASRGDEPSAEELAEYHPYFEAMCYVRSALINTKMVERLNHLYKAYLIAGSMAEKYDAPKGF